MTIQSPRFGGLILSTPVPSYPHRGYSATISQSYEPGKIFFNNATIKTDDPDVLALETSLAELDKKLKEEIRPYGGWASRHNPLPPTVVKKRGEILKKYRTQATELVRDPLQAIVQKLNIDQSAKTQLLDTVQNPEQNFASVSDITAPSVEFRTYTA